MKKNLTILLLLPLLAILFNSCGISKDVYNQVVSDKNNLKKENTELKAKLKGLTEDYDLLKVRCGATETLLESKCGKVVFQLLKAKGSRKKQKITFDFEILNLGPNIKGFNFRIGEYSPTNIQYEGQIYKAGSRNLAGCKTSSSGCDMDLNTNIPLKVQLVFYGMLESGDKVANAAIVGTSFRPSKRCDFKFQNIPIEWVD